MKRPPEITVQLIHIQGGLKGEIQEFTDSRITIGRLPSYTLHFPAGEPGVSREHARIERDGNQFKLIALKDTFGTFVNGRQVREVLLRNGDVIEFGSAGPKVSFNTEFREPTCKPKSNLASERAGEQFSEWASEPVPARPLLRTSPAAVNELLPEPHCEAPRFSPAASGCAELPGEEMPPRREQQPREWHKGQQQLDNQQQDQQVQRASAPLTIQFGPTIRTYRELPVVIGAHRNCDFVLQVVGILDQQAQIYFQQGGYYLQDLTGQGTLRVNGLSLDAPVRLNPGDELKCGPHGPIFKFLGEGRLAEVEAAQPCPAAETPRKQREYGCDPPGEPPPASFLSKLIKGLKS
jgi:pSer/pThr/pTyr-binding forkhead associated (FHA) protein